MANSIQWEERGLQRQFTGKISGREILGSNLSLQGNEKFDQLRFIVNDFAGVTAFELTDHDIAAIASIDNVASKTNAYIRIAIIVKLESLRVWANLYIEKMQGSSFKCKIFDNSESAYRWAREY